MIDSGVDPVYLVVSQENILNYRKICQNIFRGKPVKNSPKNIANKDIARI